MNTFRTTVLACLLAFGFAATGAEPIDINSADAKTIAAAIDGVGEKRAQAIVAYRESNGPFVTIDDVVKDRGVGQKTVDASRAKLQVR